MGSEGALTSRGEQRQSRRWSARLRCWVSDTMADRFVALADLSADGARVVTATPPPVGEAVTLRLHLSAQEPEVVVRGRVAWRVDGFAGRGGVMGVAFADRRGPPALVAFVDDRL